MNMDSFYQYIPKPFAKGTRRLKVIASVSSFVTVVGVFIGWLLAFSTTDTGKYIQQHFDVIPAALNLLVICILAPWLAGSKPRIDERYPIESKACRRFYYSWICVWGGWFFFYLFILFKTHNDVGNTSCYWSAGENTINNIHTSFMLVCYFLLAWPLAATDATKFLPSAFITLASTIAFLAAAEFLWAQANADTYMMYHDGFRILSAFGGGAAISFMASRLGSHFMGRVLWAAAILFLYALVQTGYSVFEHSPGVKIGVLFFALPCKVWLFFLLRWIMTRGKLLFYFCRSTKLREDLPGEWAQFFLQPS